MDPIVTARQSRDNRERQREAIGRTMIRVVVIDDHPLVRETLRFILSGAPDVEVVGEAADGYEAISAVQAYRPDVAVMDITMPHLGGLEALDHMRQQIPSARVVLVTAHPDEHYGRLCREAGVACVQKEDAGFRLLPAVYEAAGRQPVSTRAAWS